MVTVRYTQAGRPRCRDVARGRDRSGRPPGRHTSRFDHADPVLVQRRRPPSARARDRPRGAGPSGGRRTWWWQRGGIVRRRSRDTRQTSCRAFDPDVARSVPRAIGRGRRRLEIGGYHDVGPAVPRDRRPRCGETSSGSRCELRAVAIEQAIAAAPDDRLSPTILRHGMVDRATRIPSTPTAAVPFGQPDQRGRVLAPALRRADRARAAGTERPRPPRALPRSRPDGRRRTDRRTHVYAHHSSRGSRRKVGCAPATSWRRPGTRSASSRRSRSPSYLSSLRCSACSTTERGCGRRSLPASCRWQASPSEKRVQRVSVGAVPSGSRRSCWPRGSGCSGSRSRCTDEDAPQR